MKNFFNFIFSRIFFIFCMVLSQLLFLTVFLVYFNRYFIYLYSLNLIVGMIFTFMIINDNINPAFKITWILISIALPFLGGVIYLTFGEKRLLKSVKKRLYSFSIKFKDSMDLSKDYDIENLNDSDMNVYRQAKYINSVTGSPIFFNTKTKYFSSGEASFEEYLEDLKTAERFIFMEYYIFSEGAFLESILEIFKEKVKNGVDVRILLDDIGSILTLSNRKIEEIRSFGIKVVEFNPIKGIILPKHNNRTHRKMTIIDGKIAYTGGINIADEYINVIEKYGYWKDSVLRLEGHAVWQFINMFISLWDYSTGENTDISSLYGKNEHESSSKINEEDGVVIPFTETPVQESMSENMYLNMIRRANRYIYITTPYLIITWEMEKALISAAKMGVDVRIITPHIPDKRYVHLLTRSFYKNLVDNGVKIYEFEKGFIHAKNCICDDEFVVIGSINLDYRSLYLHFECAVWTYGAPIVKDVKEDFELTLKESLRITPDWIKSRSLLTRVLQSLLKLFAPLM